MTEPVCEHGSQKRKCVICENIDLENRVSEALSSLRLVDERDCSINVWNHVQDAIEILSE